MHSNKKQKLNYTSSLGREFYKKLFINELGKGQHQQFECLFSIYFDKKQELGSAKFQYRTYENMIVYSLNGNSVANIAAFLVYFFSFCIILLMHYYSNCIEDYVMKILKVWNRNSPI